MTSRDRRPARPGNDPGKRRARLPGSGDVPATSPHDVRLLGEPVRTCVGCRERDLRAVLLRVTVAEDGGQGSAAPDPDHRAAGRGAWVHPELSCLDAAERRRAFPRALRHAGPLDLADLRAYLVAVRCSPTGVRPGQEQAIPASTVEAESGSDSDEHPMSSQQ